MKKGLRPFPMIPATTQLSGSESETWWRRVCDFNSFAICHRTNYPNNLNLRPDEEGFATLRSNPYSISRWHCIWIWDLMKKGLRLSKDFPWSFKLAYHLNLRPDEEGFATRITTPSISASRKDLNLRPDEEGFATFSSHNPPSFYIKGSESETWWRRVCDKNR